MCINQRKKVYVLFLRWKSLLKLEKTVYNQNNSVKLKRDLALASFRKTHAVTITNKNATIELHKHRMQQMLRLLRAFVMLFGSLYHKHNKLSSNLGRFQGQFDSLTSAVAQQKMMLKEKYVAKLTLFQNKNKKLMATKIIANFAIQMKLFEQYKVKITLLKWKHYNIICKIINKVQSSQIIFISKLKENNVKIAMKLFELVHRNTIQQKVGSVRLLNICFYRWMHQSKSYRLKFIKLAGCIKINTMCQLRFAIQKFKGNLSLQRVKEASIDLPQQLITMFMNPQKEKQS